MENKNPSQVNPDERSPETAKKAGFSFRYTVPVGDINYGGHMGNEKFLLLFHEARRRFLKSLGFSEQDIGEGAGIIMTEAYVKYISEVFMHDELKVSVVVTKAGGTRFTIEYLVEKEGQAKPAATGYTVQAAFDYNQRRVVKVPRTFLERTVS